MNGRKTSIQLNKKQIVACLVFCLLAVGLCVSTHSILLCFSPIPENTTARMVLPSNPYKGTPHNSTSDIGDARALETVCTKLNKKYTVTTASAPTSYMDANSSIVYTPQTHNYYVHSVGGGSVTAEQQVSSQGTTHSENSVNVIAHAVTLPVNSKRYAHQAEVLAPFSEETPFEDIQRAAPPGTKPGSGTGTVFPVGDCPWELFPLMLLFVYFRKRG